MKYSKDVIKEFEQLSFHVNNHQDAPRPLNWQKLTTYEQESIKNVKYNNIKGISRIKNNNKPVCK